MLNQKIFLLFLFTILISSVFNKVERKKCGEEVIDNCIKCGTGENEGTCAQCEDNYFLFFHNLLCLPCDHPLYGQIGCGGNCDGSNYQYTGFAFCDNDDCKEGFFNLNGICFRCSDGSPGCSKCIVQSLTGEVEDNEYTCNECISNEYKYSLTNKNCDRCLMQHCLQCHYTLDYQDKKCDKCFYGFYSNSEGICKKCHYYVSIPNGYCKVCSDDLTDYNTGTCWCYSYSTKKDHSTCAACPSHCPYCKYNKKSGKTECIRCDNGYTVNPDKTCSYCGDGCQYCFLGQNLKPICTYCFSRTLTDDNTCLICPNNCKRCKLDKNNNIICTECDDGYGLNKNGTCESCPSKCRKCYYRQETNNFACTKCYDSYYHILGPDNLCYSCNELPDNGPGCATCRYNFATVKYECKRCFLDSDPESYRGLLNYVYVQNIHKCLINTDPSDFYLYGCVFAKHIQENKYECTICKRGFISVINDKTCRKVNEINLSENCEVAENLGNKENPKYSCYTCKSDYAKVKDSEGIADCRYKDNNLVYCSEATKYSNNEISCTKCVDNSHMNDNNICECNSDSFGKNTFCYTCDDNQYGMEGCLATDGCQYITSNDEIKCNTCKNGYITYLGNQCFSCSNFINNCNSCYIDNSTQKLICDSCNEGFTFNNETNQCEYSKCEEHFEVMPGCIICDNKLEEYKSKNKCQYCAGSYFKTKNESCIYCRSEKYGGPACDRCGYAIDENGNETEEIICKLCYYYNSALNSKRKCYNCKYDFDKGCSHCKFIINKDENTEKLICTGCNDNYYLKSDGHCYNFLSFFEKEPNCLVYSYYVGNSLFYYNDLLSIEEYYRGREYYNYNYDYNDYYYYLNSNNSLTLEKQKTECIRCQNGFFKNDEGNCEKLSDEKCSLISIIENYSQKYRQCNDYFNKTNYSSIDYLIENENNDQIENTDEIENNEERGEDLNNTIKINLEYVYQEYNKSNQNIDSLNEKIKSLIYNSKFYISNSGKGGENEPQNLRRCKKSEYIQNNNSYICVECQEGFSLDNETNICKQEIKVEKEIQNCFLENIGTDSNPIYSCIECYSYKDILITAENGAKYCIKPINELDNCIEADADTTYISSIFNCTSCPINYIPYYSRFFERKICQNIYQDIIKEKSIPLTKYEEEEKVPTKDGVCENNKLFTPDGINCYECNNKNIGMPGCKGSCSFSLKRNDILKCEEGACKTGYIEKSKGICEACGNINRGCAECHYENDYPKNYLGFKRKRSFVCDLCEEDYVQSSDGKCIHCSEIGFPNCERCKHDTENDNEFICSKCSEGYYLTEDGYCKNCKYPTIIGKNNNKCIYCDDINNGGIEGCYQCENKNGNIICQYCKNGYILLTNNNTCLKLSENNDLQKYSNCDRLSLDNNNKLYCSKCKLDYSLLKENNEYKCISSDTYYYSNNYRDYLYYYHNRKYYLYPCQEIINYGTEDKPIISCVKCYEVENPRRYFLRDNYYYYDYYDYYDYYYYYDYYDYFDEKDYNRYKIEFEYTKIIEPKTKRDYCISPDVYYSNSTDDLENCTEAIKISKSKKGSEIFNCTKCKENNYLVYDSDLDIYYCKSINNQNKCMVQYCRTCQNNNNYFCEACLSSNYVVNKLTGSCMKKTDVVPAITWKDIFRLQMNSVKLINNKPIYGPSLQLKGLTNSQINTRHSFLVYLTFKIKHTRNNRNLEETKKVPTICEIEDNVDATNDDVNIVNYDCIGNTTLEENLNDYNLAGIEEGDNDGLLKNSNLAELAQNSDLTDLENKQSSSFKLNDLVKVVTFEMDEIKNLTSDDYNFDINVNGKLNKELEPISINTKIELAQVDKKVDCKFNIEPSKKANLNCQVNIQDYKNYKQFSFKVTDIQTEDNSIYLSKIDEIVLFNNADENEEKNNKTTIIIISVVISVIVLAGIAVGIYFFRKKYKNKKKELNTNTNANTNTNDVIVKRFETTDPISRENLKKKDSKN